MKISDKMETIKVSAIDLSDERYSLFKPFNDSKSLAESIQSAGLIHPVWVRPSDDHYIVVSGFNRVKAFQINNDDEIPVRIVTGNDLACLKMAIPAVAFNRDISIAELIRCLRRLSGYMDATAIAEDSDALFNTQLNKKYISELIDIGGLQDPALELIDSGRLSVKTAKKLVSFSHDDKKCVLDLFSRVKASVNVQKEIIQHLFEISKRDMTDISAILLKSDVQKVVNASDKDPAATIRNLRQTLYTKRYPQLSQAQEDLKADILALKPGPHLKIEKSDNFEDPHLYISLKVKTMDQYTRSIDKLKQLDRCSELKKIIEQ